MLYPGQKDATDMFYPMGPDGIPYRAYRHMKGFIKILIRLLIISMANGIHEVVGDFNDSIIMKHICSCKVLVEVEQYT